MWRKKTHKKNVYLVFDLILVVVVVADICFVPSFIHIFKFVDSSTHGAFVISLSISLSRFYFFFILFTFVEQHYVGCALAYTHIHSYISTHRTQKFSFVVAAAAVALLLLFRCTQINYECKVPQPVDIFVGLRSLTLARSLFLYLSINLSIPLSEQLFRIDTHFLSRSRCYGWICCRYIRLLWSQWCVLMHVSNEMLLLQ